LKPALLPSYSLTLSPEELSEWWISGYFTIYCNFGVDFNPLENSPCKIYSAQTPASIFRTNPCKLYSAPSLQGMDPGCTPSIHLKGGRGGGIF
jgi:hypothetical protein